METVNQLKLSIEPKSTDDQKQTKCIKLDIFTPAPVYIRINDTKDIRCQ